MTQHKLSLAERQVALKEKMVPKKKEAAEKKKAAHRSDAAGRKWISQEWHNVAVTMAAAGATPTQISKSIGHDMSSVSRFLRSNQGKKLALDMFGGESIENIKAMMRNLWPLCLKAIDELLRSSDPSLKVQKATKALDLLGMIGAKEQDKKETTHTHTIQVIRDSMELAEKEALAAAPPNPLINKEKKEPIGHA